MKNKADNMDVAHAANERILSRRSFLRSCKAGVGIAAAGMLASSGAALSLGGCAPYEEFITGKRTIVDHIGRSVEIPSVSALRRIYFTSPLAQIFCFTIAPDLLAGTAMQYQAKQLEFLPEGTEKLDYLGTLSNGGSIDVEALRSKDVQMIFSISGTDLTDVNIADAISLQESSGIPVVLIDGSFERIEESYALLGECLGRKERAEELGAYCSRIYERVTEAVSQVPAEKLVRYYFAEGDEGLWTEPDVSQHSLAFQTARGVNVAGGIDPASEGRHVQSATIENRNMVQVAIDEVRAWNPDFIITWDIESRSGAADLIQTHDAWKGIKAVETQNVFPMPNLPFAICDRPPGVNRFLGIQWLANLFYPDYYDVDMVEVVREFYSTCYWRDITVDQAYAVLGMRQESFKTLPLDQQIGITSARRRKRYLPRSCFASVTS